MNPKITTKLAEPIDYETVDLLELANLNLDGLRPTFGSYDEETGHFEGDNPAYRIYATIIRDAPVTPTDMAYLEYVDGSGKSPFRWHPDEDRFTFDPALVGQVAANAQVVEEASVAVGHRDEVPAGDPSRSIAELHEVTTEDIQEAVAIAAAPPAVQLIAHDDIVSAKVDIDTAVKAGLVLPIAVPPVPSLPFPHDPAATHAIDNLPANTVTTITARGTMSIDHPNGAVSSSIPAGDALSHLPVGTQIHNGTDGGVMVLLPETEDRPQLVGLGAKLHQAIHSIWAWIVAEGHAVLAEL